MTKEQITVTLDEYNLKILRAIAKKSFEGNISMALRATLTQCPMFKMPEEKS